MTPAELGRPAADEEAHARPYVAYRYTARRGRGDRPGQRIRGCAGDRHVAEPAHGPHPVGGAGRALRRAVHHRGRRPAGPRAERPAQPDLHLRRVRRRDHGDPRRAGHRTRAPARQLLGCDDRRHVRGPPPRPDRLRGPYERHRIGCAGSATVRIRGVAGDGPAAGRDPSTADPLGGAGIPRSDVAARAAGRGATRAGRRPSRQRAVGVVRDP